MSKKKQEPKKEFTEADALSKIDMSAVTPEGILGIIKQVGDLKRENQELKQNIDFMNSQPHFPYEMSITQYNWMVTQLEEIREKFLKAIGVPATLAENPVKIITL